jgi:RHS repeat-associated protein
VEFDSNIQELQATFDNVLGVYDYSFGVEYRPAPISNTTYVGGSWRYTIPALQATATQIGVNPKAPPAYCYDGFIVTLADGSKHQFGNKAHCFQIINGKVNLLTSDDVPTMSLSFDSAGLLLDTTNENDIILHLKNGSVMHFDTTFPSAESGVTVLASKMEDTNGNIVTISGTYSIADTLGREITVSSGVIGYKDSNGATQSVTLGFTVGNLTSITLPNNLKYSFEYTNGYLTQVTYPDGGYTQYGYGTFTALWSAGQSAPGQADPYTELTSRSVCPLATGTCSSSQLQTTTYSPTISGTQMSNQYMDVTDPLGNRTHYQFTYGTNPFSPAYSPREILRQVYDAKAGLLRTVQTCYDSLTSCPTTTTFNSSLPVRVTTTLNDVNPPLVKKVETDYETASITLNGSTETVTLDNIADEYDYDYGSNTFGSLLRHILNTWMTTNSVNSHDYTVTSVHILDRKSSQTIYDGSATKLAYTAFEYDNFTSGLSASGATQHDSTYATTYTIRGNLTATQHWRNTDGATLTTRSQYDDAGNIVSTTDPKGNTTSFSFADSWGNAACAPSGGHAAAYLTATTDALQGVTSHTYNSCSGTVATTTDVNSQLTSSSYDSMGRVTETILPPNPLGERGAISETYNESSFPLTITTTTTITASNNKTTAIVLDGVGRETQSQLDSDPKGIVYLDTTYDSVGRKSTVSNPYHSPSLGTDPPAGVTTYVYDALNRITQTIPQDGSSSANNVTTVYSGNSTTVTDEAGNQRRSFVDGLGRLTEVDEPGQSTPGSGPYSLSTPARTLYTFDGLGNLTSVTQSSSRPRTFTHDSLSELLTSQNPEAGSVTYTYDNDGNVATKTDARGLKTTYSYDALNHLTSKVYSNGDPTVSYSYSGTSCLGQTTCYNKERITGMTDAPGGEVWCYDSMGRVLTDRRNTNSITLNTTYTYNLDGSIATLTYPDGLVITYAYDNAQRQISATDGSGISYASAALYTSQGAISSVTLGQSSTFTGISLSGTYDKRLQPIEIKASSSAGTALDLIYGFGLGTADNGNVLGITNNLDSTRSQAFTYDPLSRIATAGTVNKSSSNCWGEQYTYDAWANLTAIAPPTGYTGCTVETLSIVVSAANQVNGFSYDASGNVTGDTHNQYTWNSESQIKTVAGVTYTYDGLGNRLEKSSGTLYWQQPGGEALEETTLAGAVVNDYIYFAGKRIARKTSSAAVYYYLEDHLGTSRAITNSSGSKCYDADFYPFGGERVLTNTCPQNYKFTGKERDAESGNDDYGARYYASSLGRFLSPDWSAIPVPVPYANLSNPQTLNLYAMVSDNPETFADLDGHGQYGGFHLGIIGDAPVPQATSADALAMFEGAWDPSTFTSTPDSIFGLPNSSAQNQSQTQTQQLSASDVSEGIKAFDSDKEDKNPGRVVKALDAMGKDFTVSGDTLRQGVKDSGVALPKDADKVLANVNSITRTGDKVVITNENSMSIKGAGQLAKTISFTINESVKGKSGYQGPAIQNLKGVGIGFGPIAYHPDHWGPE